MLDGSALLQHVLARFLLFASRLNVNGTRQLPTRRVVGGLSRVDPYWVVYTTSAKGRWFGRPILDVLATEFRERGAAYYRCAIDSGATTMNGKLVRPETVIRSGDRIENVSHSHEPPVTATPIRILHHDTEREFLVIDKPASIPVHPSGKYYYHTVVELLKNEHGFDRLFTANRLDRLTSGLLVIPLSAARATAVGEEFRLNTVHKTYLARCIGEFPEEEVVCEQPLLIADKQIGLTVVHPSGKSARTVFQRVRYDRATNTSVVLCKPVTGRCHQIRVHLQYLGYPIANDVIYAEPQIWGPELGKGGAPPINTRFVARSMHARSPPAELPADVDALVHNLRALKASESAPSEATYWPRFRAAVLAAKEAVLVGSERPVAPLPQRRDASPDSAVPSTLPQLGPAAALASFEDVEPEPTEAGLCADCRAPARADPRPEELCIFLHALRYEMELGAFETAPPAWASEGWVWGAPV